LVANSTAAFMRPLSKWAMWHPSNMIKMCIS
jgi:hypothetical protein